MTVAATYNCTSKEREIAEQNAAATAPAKIASKYIVVVSISTPSTTRAIMHHTVKLDRNM